MMRTPRSSGPRQHFGDILESIEDLEGFIAGMGYEGFASDQRTISAVERKLQIISEAASRLGAEAEVLCPGVPWRDVRDYGNWLRHAYDGVPHLDVWRTVHRDIPPLKAAVTATLQRLGSYSG